MAGHSKWANIQHKKGKTDAQRGKLFTRLIREVTVAARLGGADVKANPRLRSAIETALSANMAKDTVERAAARGAGDLASDSYEELRYEGYGPHGVAVVVDCMTDNRNRTVAEIRHAFSKCGGKLGTDGSVSYLFQKIGYLSFGSETDQDALMDAAIEAGADDVLVGDDGSQEILIKPDDFHTVASHILAAGYVPETQEITLRADNTVELELEQAEKMMHFIDMLEELDDVQKVYSNAEISNQVLDALGAS
jgi:YebC/PmpR family DNA-binding regulatory protein